MYTALLTLEKFSNPAQEQTVRIDTTTDRTAELTQVRRRTYPGWRIREVLEQTLADGAVAPITTPAAPNAPKVRLEVVARIGQQRAVAATVLAFSSRFQPDSNTESGWNCGVLFELAGESRVWVNDCPTVWEALGIIKHDCVTLLNIAPASGSPVWVLGGRFSPQQAA